MRKEEVNEIIQCLSGERTLFYYYKNRYCLDMIQYYYEQYCIDKLSINQLNNGSLSRFANKPIVKDLLKHCGDGFLYSHQLNHCWPKNPLVFVLTLASWADGERGWDQTSRNQSNLVLQINFDNQHNLAYQRLLKPNHYGPFEYHSHPVRQDHRKTMSWVRIDLDFSTNEALIEEVQNDWLRSAFSQLAYIKRRAGGNKSISLEELVSGIHGTYQDFEYYIEETLRPYNNIWAEASLMAAIEFIRNELGISTIYYHTYETGKKIKCIDGCPPKSMYTTLPKQFGFELTNESPQFLRNHKTSRRYLKAIKSSQWYRLMV